MLGLQKDSFNVFDQGKQEVIRHLSSEDAPISVGIIFDASGSMYGKMERSREAVLQFLHSSNPEDEFFLVAFNDRPELLVDFTSSVDEIQIEGKTGWRDGLVGRALSWLGPNKEGPQRTEGSVDRFRRWGQSQPVHSKGSMAGSKRS